MAPETTIPTKSDIVAEHKRSLIAVPIAAGICLFLLVMCSIVFRSQLELLWPNTSDIRELQELQLGPVRLRGVVTYVDAPGKRFWIQDESGAILINQDPTEAGIHFKQLVQIEAKKTHPYDPQLGFGSVVLTGFRITVVKARGELPPPAPATIQAFPEKEKNGIRVTMRGVLHSVSYRKDGLAVATLGTSGQEVFLMLPRNVGDLSAWVNAAVQVTGVSDVLLDEGGSAQSKNIWVQDGKDIEKISAPPMSVPLYSLRDLYRTRKEDDGHRVRLRGRVVALENGNFLQLEDEWGIAGCRLDDPVSFGPGAAVEIAGFPLSDGLREDLSHCTVTSIPNSQLKWGQPQISPLTTIAAVKRLSDQQAETALPARITGVITVLDTDWHQFFLQDSTSGVFVKYSSSTVPLFQGEKLTVIGLTNPGDFAPVIVSPKLVPLGRTRLPKPIPLTPQAWSGAMDSRFVEVEGVIHGLRGRQNPRHLSFYLYTWFGPVHVNASADFGNMSYLRNLEDATVRLRGVCGEIFNSRRQMIGIQVALWSSKGVDVLEAPQPDPFQISPVAINKLLRFSPNANLGHRVRITGSVTMIGSDFFYVQDRTGGARVEGDPKGLQLDDLVDVLGYVSAAGYSPGLTDAAVRIRQHDMPVPAQPLTPESMAGGQLDSQLVTVEGRLLSIVNSVESKTLVLRSAGRTFDATLNLPNSEQPAPALEPGSVLRLSGVYSVQLRSSTAYMLITKDPVGFRLVIRSPQDIHVLQPASWWNMRHTSEMLGVLAAGTLIGIGWLEVLRRRVRRQRRDLQKAKEKAEAIEALTAAMEEVITEKRFTSRVSLQSDDEIARLGAEFNKMLTELHVRDLAKAEAEAKLQHQALTDELTGLPNRRLLSDRLSQVLAMAQREPRVLALLYLDLDGFKLVNDSLGHTAGDELLRQVTQRLRTKVRQSDTLARLGGDEFTVILTTLHSKDEAGLVAKKLLGLLETPFVIDNHDITIGASIGISIYPDNGADAAELLQQADAAMYSAKRSGKNRVTYFTAELGSMVRERLNLENQLRVAVARGEIAVHYQAEFDVATRRLVRFEALARWQHPTLGNIPPLKFIPIAEESGLIVPLGAFILERACADAVTWQKESDHPIQVAVNVSSVQFVRETFVDEVVEVLRHTGLDPKLLQIELTESAMLDGTEYAAAIMKRLGALGVSIAIDDFGTGYSCFSYLPRLPFNTLKIDRAFVRELGKRVEMKALIQSLVVLAHHLEMQVVVEGIETDEQLEIVRNLGGNQVQGYLLGRPTSDPISQLRTSVQPSKANQKNARGAAGGTQ